ncbi:hypothetical protein D915_008364 [Fasciola hepatica]|uniref:Apple domain-containing protein n=1 Tax=Fasciola hepatica TaxID=6192 RepID=A0A4E0QZQ0_FASHE|nr:hypothetical protein D915_008364 [Fasciola hepatica]
MLRALILLLLSFGCTQAQDYFSPNIFYSNVYASSVQPGSDPKFAVDADFLETMPTCFLTNVDYPDLDGFHWILIDFGVGIANIREIRMAIASRGDSARDPDDNYPIEAFVISHLKTPKSDLNSSSVPKQSLSWTSPYYHECSGTELGSAASQSVTVKCPTTYTGRWLAIRSKSQLNICLVSVYIEQAFGECFETQSTTNGRKLLGTVFRYVRHTPQEACRSACMQASDCEATVFTKQRSSGICQLISNFHILNQGDPNEFEDEADRLLDCPSGICVIEMNYCHGGTVQKLESKINQTNATEAAPVSASSNAQLEEEWLVTRPKRHRGDQSVQPVYVLSVSFEGQLECEAWDCGSVYVVVVDGNGTEHFCGTFDTAQVFQLDKVILFCNSTDLILEPTAVRLRWYQLNVNNDQGGPRLQIRIQRGNIRVSSNKPIPKTTTTTVTEATTTVIPVTTASTVLTTTMGADLDVTLSSGTPRSIGSRLIADGENMDDEFAQIVPSGPALPETQSQPIWTERDKEESKSWILPDESRSFEFNYPLNDQQLQIEDRGQRRELHSDRVENTSPPSVELPSTSTVDRVHERRNALRQVNSPNRIPSSQTDDGISVETRVCTIAGLISLIQLVW